MRRYLSDDDDSARWERFAFRQGDIVVSARSKSGTTWTQMICALLVFGTPDLPAPLPVLSPWLDHRVEPLDEVLARLDAQQHRRLVKTHTPLDGLPLDERATYVVVGRHPLDMAVSLYHQADNLDRDRIAELTGVPARPRAPRRALHDWLVAWTLEETSALERPDSLVGVLHHLSDAWARRGTAPDVVLVHYADLLADLPGEMRRLAARLDLEVSEDRLHRLAASARFASMRARSRDLAPDTLGVLKDAAAFFRAGRSGAGRELLTAEEGAAYEQRVAALVGPELRAWLHR